MADFRGYVTAAGQTFEALAKQMGYPVTIGFIEVGDGKLPDSESPIARTQLVHKLKQFPAIVEQDTKNPGQWVATCYIPADDAINGAGYFIREIGCKLINQGDGVLYAYRRVSDDWKPVITSGEAKSFIYKLRFIPSNGELLTPTIDPSVVLVDKEELARVINAHVESRDHPYATTALNGLVKLSADVLINDDEQKQNAVTMSILWDWASAVAGIKTPEHFIGDDYQRIKSWLLSGGDLYINKEYKLDKAMRVEASGINVKGRGKIVFKDTVKTSGAVLEIVGNNNKLHEISVEHEGDMRSAGTLLCLSGDKCRAEGVGSSFLTAFNPTKEGEQYSGTCILLNGHASSAIECHGGGGGTGVSENGKNNILMRNNFDDCCRVASNGNKSRDAIVDGNTGDCKHKGYPLQGCDGIWGNRSHRFTKYSNNVIKNPGEHGAYLQGDGFVWDNTNRVEGAKKCIIKVGAKNDGNYSYPGETLPAFDLYGVPSDDGFYATTSAHIAPRGSDNNQSGSSDGCVCLQPNIADITIDDYEVIDNPLSPFGIRSLYFFDGSPNQVLSNIRLGKGKVLRSGKTSLACASGLEVDGFYSGQPLNITAASSPVGTTDVTITAECPYVDFTSNPRDISIVGGKYRYISESSGENISLINVTITNQEAGGSMSHGRVRKIQGGNIIWNGLDVFNINGVTDVLGVTIDAPNCASSYPVQFNFGADSPLQGHFDGNTIRAPLSRRAVRIGGKDATCNSNVIVGAVNSDYPLTIQGNNVTAIGNSLNAGALRLDSTATNCFVVGKNISDGNPQGGNTVISS